MKLYCANGRQMLPQCTVALTRVGVKFDGVAPVTPSASKRVPWEGPDLDVIRGSFSQVLRCDEQGLYPRHVLRLRVNAQRGATGIRL